MKRSSLLATVAALLIAAELILFAWAGVLATRPPHAQPDSLECDNTGSLQHDPLCQPQPKQKAEQMVVWLVVIGGAAFFFCICTDRALRSEKASRAPAAAG